MKRSYLIAAAIVVAVTLWMMLGPVREEEKSTQSATQEVEARTEVQVKAFQAEQVQRELVLYGQSEPNRRVTVRAEVAGPVAAVLVPLGESVKEGELILRLAEEDRPQRLEQAKALVQQRELEYEGARSLKARGLQAERQLAEALTLLRSARADLKRAQLNLQNTRLAAPFSGVLQARHVEVGDFLSVGDPIAEVVELDPLLVTGDVSEREVGVLETGMAAMVALSNGIRLEGKLRFIASTADQSTRTYHIEVEVANPPPYQRGGMSATISIPRASVSAHKVTPALLSLDDAGILGVKGVDEEGVVQFHPVEILKSERDGIWLAGLPAEVRLITVGQGFVVAGDRVDVVMAQ